MKNPLGEAQVVPLDVRLCSARIATPPNCRAGLDGEVTTARPSKDDPRSARDVIGVPQGPHPALGINCQNGGCPEAPRVPRGFFFYNMPILSLTLWLLRASIRSFRERARDSEEPQ